VFAFELPGPEIDVSVGALYDVVATDAALV